MVLTLWSLSLLAARDLVCGAMVRGIPGPGRPDRVSWAVVGVQRGVGVVGSLGAQRVAGCGGLRLHPTKTRIVYCKKSGRHGRHDMVTFDFLGYTFKPRAARRKDGTMFTTFTPAISRTSATAIRRSYSGTCRS